MMFWMPKGTEHSAHHAGDAHPQLVGNAALGDLVDDGGAGGADTDGGGEAGQTDRQAHADLTEAAQHPAHQTAERVV